MFDTNVPAEQVSKIQSHLESVRNKATMLHIENDEAMEQAQQQLSDIAQSKKTVKKFEDKFLDPIKNALTEMKANITPVTEARKAYAEIEDILKDKMTVYIAKKREEEQKQAEKERKERDAKQEENKRRMNQLIDIGMVWRKDDARFVFAHLFVLPTEIEVDKPKVWEEKVKLLKEKIEALKKDMKPKELPKQEKGVEAPEIIPDPEPVKVESMVKKTGGTTVYTVKRWTFKEVDLNKIPREYLLLDTKKVNQAIKDGARDIPGLEIFEEERPAVRTK